MLGRKELIDELKELALVNYGGILSPANAWLIAREIESLIVYNDDSVKEMAYYPEIFKKGFFRFSVGLEDANDLIADLQQAFEKAGIA